MALPALQKQSRYARDTRKAADTVELALVFTMREGLRQDATAPTFTEIKAAKT